MCVCMYSANIMRSAISRIHGLLRLIAVLCTAQRVSGTGAQCCNVYKVCPTRKFAGTTTQYPCYCFTCTIECINGTPNPTNACFLYSSWKARFELCVL